MLALKLAGERGELSPDELKAKLHACSRLPNLVRRVLETQSQVVQMARTYRYASNFLYLGRGFSFPVALEGALKLKEISCVRLPRDCLVALKAQRDLVRQIARWVRLSAADRR